MKQRVLTGVVFAVMFIPVLFLSGTVIFNIVIALLSAIGVYEMLRCTGELKNGFLSVPALFYAVIGPLLARTRFATAYGLLLSITILFMFYLMFLHVLLPDRLKTSDLAVVFMTSVYITVGFTSIVRIRDVAGIGKYLFLFIFIGAWSTDIFAYFCGRLFGRHKLSPRVSPKKTVEGSIGGIVFCLVAFVLYALLIATFTGMHPQYLRIALIGAFISVVAQFGDLTLSAVKRDYAIKDYGTIFPGHGGVLDRFDSVLAIAPFLFLLTGNAELITIFNQLP